MVSEVCGWTHVSLHHKKKAQNEVRYDADWILTIAELKF